MSRTAWYKLQADDLTEEWRLEAASERDALRSFMRETGLKLGFAEEGETGAFVLTNTSTGETWWVITSP
jgi:hypothetical protein